MRALRRWWHDLLLAHRWRRDAWYWPGDGHWWATVWHCECGRQDDGTRWR
jgi:hypothetical protein